MDPDALLLADLIERAAELKGELVAFGQSARFDRWLTPLLLEAAGPEGQLDETGAIRVIDHFLLRYRLPDGSTVVDRFVTGRRGLTGTDRELLLGWRDPVEGIFEVRGKDGDVVVLLNLVDDLEYRAYSNVGGAAFRGTSQGPAADAGGLTVRLFALPARRPSGLDPPVSAFGTNGRARTDSMRASEPLAATCGWLLCRPRGETWADVCSSHRSS